MGSKDLKPADFVALHNHTHYSLLDGLQKVAPMLDRVKELGMEAVAITDHGTMSGAIELYQEADARGIKPIIGMETYIAARKYDQKEPGKDKLNFHLILLAQNNVGYQNLMRLSTIANLEGFYYRPRIDRELLEKHNEGIIVLSGCIGSEVGDALRRDQYAQAKEIATWYKKVFKERYYLELQDHGHPDHPKKWDEQVSVNEGLMKLSKELDIPCVVTMDAHYRLKEDQEAHEILLCVQTGAFLDEDNRMSLKNFELHLADPVDVIQRWGDTLPSAITNTKKIADMCSVHIELGKILIPQFPLPEKLTEKEHLDTTVYQGLAFRYGGVSESAATKLSKKQILQKLPEAVKERTAFELSIIDQMGFNGYFLIIADFMNWGKERGIVFGPGRGSAAGSIIAYALRITELDPLEYDLLFERFLNPDRISMPDIDIDIQDSRRDEVIQYCVEKYGDDRVANIVTFGRMAARNAVRDVARVLRVPYAEADRLAKMIPPPIQGRHIPLEVSIKENAELKAEYKNEASKQVFDLAIRLEGTIRSHGVHAAGVVIAPDDIVKFVPLEKAQKGVVATQYSMNPVEDLGLLKMDFLGLSNLTIINNALRIIRKVYKKEIDISSLPLDDKKTYELLQQGDTTGVFQLESAGMKRYLKELKPTEFNDIIAMCALYRPGPLTAGLTDSFVRRKNNNEDITYAHEKFEDALGTTFGVLVYQEQVMRISTDVCGFSGGDADTLRKAIGKKKRDVMAKMKKKFIDGGEEHGGVPRPTMEKFWEDLMGFADYAFNKSHSACYGLIAYQTAYLKAHYPDAFMAALMTSDFDDTDRLTIEMSECQHMGIEVLPPDINESFVEFAIVPDKSQIRFGMAAVKNVGKGAVEEVLRARDEGHFASLEDFFTRVNSRIVNKKAVESLIKTGAFDRFGTRSALLNNIETLLAFSQKKQKEQDSGQTDLFGTNEGSGGVESTIVIGPEDVAYTSKDYLNWERELLGLYLSAHPLAPFKELFEEQVHKVSNITPDYEGSKVTIGGIVMGARVIQTKNGKSMAFVQLSTLSGDIELLIFPNTYEETAWLWEVDTVLIAEGKVNTLDRDGNKSDEIKIAVSSAREVSHEEAQQYKPGKKQIKDFKKTKSGKKTKMEKSEASKRIYIRMQNTSDTESLMNLKRFVTTHPGDTEVVLVVGSSQKKQAIRIPDRADQSEATIKGLQEVFGGENVKCE